MFIHIGNDQVVLKKDVIMILDKNTLTSKDTSDFLQVAKEEGFVTEIISEKDKDKKSLVITNKNIIFSPISSVTLLKRADFINKL
ncbi:MAG: extracellular matrix regulator RemB [Tepidanaerobacteraceae bacterium]